MSDLAPMSTEFRDLLARGDGARVVVFSLGGSLHGCDIRLVEEVVTGQRVHPLPDLPPFVVGMLLLRGEMVPVVEIAGALGAMRETGTDPALLVLETAGGRVGVAVDAVAEVAELPPGALRPSPHAGGDRDAYVAAVARTEAGLVTLIDLAELLRERTTLETGEP